MPAAHVEDLLSIDRDVARGARDLARWRAALAIDPEAHADESPLEQVRAVAGKSTWDALGEVRPSAVDGPLRGALRRWVFALLLARIGRDDEVAWARAAGDPRGRFEAETARLVTWRESWRALPAAATRAEARAWLSAAADVAPGLAEIARRSAARRLEAARRMGFEHPWEAVAPVAPAAVREAAARLLDATEDVSRAVLRDVGARDPGAAAADVMHAAVAREAGEGWPSHLRTTWLREALCDAAGAAPVDLPPLPRVLGAASFARALQSFGFALRVAAAPASMPFALARDPAFVGAHRLGFVFGALAGDVEFQMRALRVSRRVALAQSRVLARTALVDARLHAMRVLLGDEARFAPRDAVDELGLRVFGAPLDARLCGAWPAARVDECARLLALVDSRNLQLHLRDRHDVDWFRNPRAWSALRSAGAAREEMDAQQIPSRVDALAREFERALG